MAECHPVGFQWVMEAKARGAKVIHIDPRFTRTSAVSDLHVPIRAGSDIVFLGAIANYILSNGKEFRDYVVNYTNASVIVGDDFKDTEDLDGLFSGWDEQGCRYDPQSWQYKGTEVPASAGNREVKGASGGETHGAHGGKLSTEEPPETDPTLEDPRCVFQILKRHFSRYTPEMVQEMCGISRELFLEVAQSLVENSGRERTSAFCYAVGWTQHTVGVQYIRTAAIIQLLLGNIGRPGGGIMALRGHASIQGSTDIPTLYDLLPGYIPMPHGEKYSLEDFIKENQANSGFWYYMPDYLISLLKAYWGKAATKDNDFCFDYLPRITGDHSTYQSIMGMIDGWVKGFFVIGENPAVGSGNSKLNRKALTHLDWLVVRDFVEIETAAFWYNSPEVQDGQIKSEDIGTEVFFLPAAAHTEKDGSFTNTQRLLQWHHKALEPKGDARSDLWFYYRLGEIIRQKLKDSTDPKDRAIKELAWEYPKEGLHGDPSAEAILREINGYDAEGKTLSSYTELKDDGSTTCGCWIYSGCFGNDENKPAKRVPGRDQNWVASDWGWAWPANRRILYNRASADPEGKPWSARKAYVWWDEQKSEWSGYDEADFGKTTPPSYRPKEGTKGAEAISGTEPFIMQADGRGWLFVPNGLRDGPLPTHYEPQASPFDNSLYSQQANPVRQVFYRKGNKYNPTFGEEGQGAFPFVMTTYRLTEHHTAGGMSRFLPYLSELQPSFFCEISPELAQLRGIKNGDWATIISMNASIEARVLVTDRLAPLKIQGKDLHQVGLPYHWGTEGLSKGDSANDLFALALDPNVHIQEVKAATCDIRPGRRDKGKALWNLINNKDNSVANDSIEDK